MCQFGFVGLSPRVKVAHPAGVYPGFLSMKLLGVLLLTPRWDASLLKVYHPSISAGLPKNLPVSICSPEWGSRGTDRVI